MDFKLPNKSLVNTVIAKNKFFSKGVLSSKIKDNFTNEIQKITWKYKIAPETVGIRKTDQVEEIQIFEIELKHQSIPKSVLQSIDKLISYPILYIFTYKNHFAYGINLKDDGKKYYFSQWDEELSFEFSGVHLEQVYQNIVRQFIERGDPSKLDFDALVETNEKITQLQNEIQALNNKIKCEKQFNKKVKLNRILQEKILQLSELTKI